MREISESITGFCSVCIRNVVLILVSSNDQCVLIRSVLVCVCVTSATVVCHPCRLAVLRGNGGSSSSQQAGEEGSGQDSGQGRQEEEAHW